MSEVPQGAERVLRMVTIDPSGASTPATETTTSG